MNLYNVSFIEKRIENTFETQNHISIIYTGYPRDRKRKWHSNQSNLKLQIDAIRSMTSVR